MNEKDQDGLGKEMSYILGKKIADLTNDTVEFALKKGLSEITIGRIVLSAIATFNATVVKRIISKDDLERYLYEYSEKIMKEFKSENQ